MLNDITLHAAMNYTVAFLMTGLAGALISWSFGRIQQQVAWAPVRIQRSQPPSQR